MIMRKKIKLIAYVFIFFQDQLPSASMSVEKLAELEPSADTSYVSVVICLYIPYFIVPVNWMDAECFA